MKKRDDGTYVVEPEDKVVFGGAEIQTDPNEWRVKYVAPVPPSVTRTPMSVTMTRENIS